MSDWKFPIVVYGGKLSFCRMLYYKVSRSERKLYKTKNARQFIIVSR